MIRIKVIDKDTGKLFWKEEHKPENVERAIKDIQERTNLNHFRLEIDEV